jgi:hypothetical protein
MYFYPTLITLLLVLCIGCKTTSEAPGDETTTEDMAASQIVDGIEGTVVFMDLEGGFFGIQADSGENYFPINLADEFRENGLPVVFAMKARPDVMTPNMWGETIEIIQIARK